MADLRIMFCFIFFWIVGWYWFLEQDLISDTKDHAERRVSSNETDSDFNEISQTQIQQFPEEMSNVLTFAALETCHANQQTWLSWKAQRKSTV